MMLYGVITLFVAIFEYAASLQCSNGQSLTFNRWSGVIPEQFTPVFVYSASGDEVSLTWTCLSRCYELEDCAAVIVAYGRSGCQGVAASETMQLRVDSDVAFFQKLCLHVTEECATRWWVLETTPGYQLSTDNVNVKALLNTTMQECNIETISNQQKKLYRSAQWIGQEKTFNPERIGTSQNELGACFLNEESKFTEPESYRVTNYRTFYIENQCRHDYTKKIDRCSYEEYANQTLKHVEFTTTNYTKDECKTLCELEDRFVCRGFSWTLLPGRSSGRSERGLCDLHSEDLVSTGSWLLRRSSYATYYRRVICLNITVECESSDIVVKYRPRSLFRGRVYVPGRGEQCSANASDGLVTLRLPFYGSCDVNFAHAITYGPSGMVNRTMAYVMILIQNNPVIQTGGDRWLRAGCSLGGGGGGRGGAGGGGAGGGERLDATLAVLDNGKPSAGPTVGSPSAASAVLNTSGDPTTLTMYIARADDGFRHDPSLSLGEPLELRIDSRDASEVEAYNLVASSRLGDSSVVLIDSRGCPTQQIDFPAFTRSNASAGMQRLSARFKAFRFPNSHIVRFTLMVRRCDGKCEQPDCSNTARSARNSNLTAYSDFVSGQAWDNNNNEVTSGSGVVAEGGVACGGAGRVPMEVEVVVGSKDSLAADNLVSADHRHLEFEEERLHDTSIVCIHELLLVALVLAWLAVQILLLLGCCVLVKRYRNLAEMSMQKDYQSFDNVGFEAGSTHRRVHWPDQSVDIIHAH